MWNFTKLVVNDVLNTVNLLKIKKGFLIDKL